MILFFLFYAMKLCLTIKNKKKIKLEKIKIKYFNFFRIRNLPCTCKTW